MKLAEALIERADLKARIAQTVNRMKENAQVQEGDEPAEDVSELAIVYDSLMDKLEALVLRINKTNAETMLGEVSIADAITKRDALKAKISAYRTVREAALKQPSRYGRHEIKTVRTVDVAKLQRTIDDLSRLYRELDTRIQERNWTVALL